MRSARSGARRAIVGAGICLVGLRASGAVAQSVLDRTPNLSGGWVARPGVVQFNFLHRFMRSDAPERKVSNFPTFILAAGLPGRTMVGFYYSTNSTLAPAYPNEWEFFGRIKALSQGKGAPLDVAGQVGYNLAARGLDGEISLARQVGPFRPIAVVRALKDPDEGGGQIAVGGGLTLRIFRYLALAGDVASLTDRDAAAGEKVAWSAGLQIGIPRTPHSLSLHATNVNTATLEGASRGDDEVRYGFEFTIPFTLARYFGRRPRPSPPAAAPAQAAPGQPGKVLRTEMRNNAFTAPKLEVAAGTTIEWTNQDEVPHTVTADDKSFDSGAMEANGAFRHTFDRAGTYPYTCTLHPFMKGTVVVR
jgi:plastocyanin